MRFARPQNVRVVDMCKYIDDTVYKKELSESEKDKIYLYLYHIIYSLCAWHKYFQFEQDGDDFAASLAENIYFRLLDERQFGENPQLEPIRNCLNYIKSIMGVRIIAWQKDHKFIEVLEDYHRSTEFEYGNFIDTFLYREEIRDNLSGCDRDKIAKLVFSEIEDLPKLIDKVCKLTQFRGDASIRRNLYISCALSFLNYVTLSNKDLEKLEGSNESYYESFITRCRLRNIDDTIILWHLDKGMESMVKVLLNRVKIMFANKLHEITINYSWSDKYIDHLLSMDEASKGDYYG